MKKSANSKDDVRPFVAILALYTRGLGGFIKERRPEVEKYFFSEQFENECLEIQSKNRSMTNIEVREEIAKYYIDKLNEFRTDDKDIEINNILESFNIKSI